MAIPPVESFARIGCLTFTYVNTVEQNYSKYLELENKIIKFGDVEYDEALENLKKDKIIAGLQTIVFSAMSFEAAIYDFAAIHLGDKYVSDHLDKLDVLSKWVVVLRFVTGIELDKDQAPYGLLKRLIKTRNDLVHAKSEELDFQNKEKQLNKIDKKEKEYEESVHSSFRAIVVMSLFLEKNLNGYHNPFPTYNKELSQFHRYYPELKETIGECRMIVSNI